MPEYDALELTHLDATPGTPRAMLPHCTKHVMHVGGTKYQTYGLSPAKKMIYCGVIPRPTTSHAYFGGIWEVGKGP